MLNKIVIKKVAEYAIPVIGAVATCISSIAEQNKQKKIDELIKKVDELTSKK